MYTDTVTIFNRYDTPAGDLLYYPTIVHNCDLIVDKMAAQQKSGLADADKASLHIRYKYNDDGQMIVGGKPWLKPIFWEHQVNADLPNTVTADEGRDFFWAGEWAGESPIRSSEYGRTGFLDYMRLTYDDVYLITSAGVYGVIPHIEIGGA